MDFTSRNLTIPRGRVMFAEFRPGTKVPGAQRFMGNCPEFTLSREGNTVDHYASTSGMQNKDASIPIGGDMSGTLITDDIQPANMRYWFMGENTAVAVTAQTDVAYTLEDVEPDNYYQIGRTEQNPLGAMQLSSVTVTGGTEFEDYEVDLVSGQIWIMPNSSLTGDVQLTYSAQAHNYRRVTSGDLSIEGELTFVSDNPYGPNRRVVIPRAKLSPNGDLSFLTDPESPAFQQLSFQLQLLQKGNLPLYLSADGLPSAADAAATVE